MELTPRERVALTLKREEVDRLPVDFWAVPEVYRNLENYLHLSSTEELLEYLAIDCRVISPPYIGPRREDKGGVFLDLFGVPRRLVKNPYSTYEEFAGHPLAASNDLSVIEDHQWPESSWWDVDALPAMIEEINSKEEYSLRYDVGGIFETSWSLRGLELFLTDLITNPELAYSIMERVTDYLITTSKRVLDRVGDAIDIVYTYDDVGTQQGLFVSPEHYREYIRPHHVRLNKVLKEYGVAIMYHSCGAIMPLINDILSIPIDILNPLQPYAEGMDQRKIKKMYGDRVIFHGGIDIQHLLRMKDRDRLVEELKETVSILGEEGGYIMSSTHYLQADIPLENILLLYKEIERGPDSLFHHRF